MTIYSSEIKTQQGVSVELFQFETPFGDYYYTSYFDTLVLDNTYRAEAIDRGAGCSYDISCKPQEVTISLPLTNLLVEKLKANQDIPKMSVTISKCFLEEPTQKEVLFIGDLSNVILEDGICRLLFKDIMRFLVRQVGLVKMQSICNNILYDDKCGLSRASYQYNAIVTVSEQGKKLTSSTFSAVLINHGDLEQGVCYLSTEDEYRLILTHSSNTITINRAFKTLASGMQVVVWLGCKKQADRDCWNKFNNFANFVGMPYMPLKDLYNTPVTN